MAVTYAHALSVYRQWQPLIDQYHGGLPPGFVAAIMAHESGGRADAKGDPNLGEYGLLQVASYTPGEFGLAEGVRYDNAVNVWLGCLDLAQRGVRVYLAAPDLIELGTADFWKMARLSAAVGAAGTRNLIAAARPLQRGNAFYGIRDWANRSGGMQLSSGQDAAKVVARINTVEQTWQIGQQIAGGFDNPVKTPAPPSVAAYRLPAVVAPHFSVVTKKTKYLLAAVGALVLGGVYYAIDL